ncbi:MAG TPA: hypothetical protein VJY62_22870 [Bacteroidia bacterium]|nr:hypothetical protein [Bacteroidia bacterium]
MKKIFYVLLYLLFSGCDKSLDVELNYNPFDPDYTGPNVVFMDSLVPQYFYYINTQGDTVIYNRIVKIYVHKDFACFDSICYGKIFTNGMPTTALNPFYDNKILRYHQISAPGIYTFDAAISDGNNDSKHSDPLTITIH